MGGNTETLDIVLTDFTLHVAERRNSPSWWRAIQKAVSNGSNRFRYYSRSKATIVEDKDKMVVEMVIDMNELAEQAHREGKKLRIVMPNGTPLVAGDDTLEYIESQKRKSARIKQ